MRIFECIKNKSKYIPQIYKAFPDEYHEDVKIVINALSFNNIFVNPPERGLYKVRILMSEDSIITNLSNGIINIPARTYFEIPKKELEDKLSVTQKTIINCLFTRYYDGYERQKRVRELLKSTEEFAGIYVLSLIGDYVIEILEEINNGIMEENIQIYQEIIKMNNKYWESTKSRNISYWNEYYRHPNFEKLNHYIGTKIIKRIEGKKI